MATEHETTSPPEETTSGRLSLEDWDKRNAADRVTEIKTQLGYLTHNLNTTADLIREAYKNNDWETLGFTSWKEYCEKNFHSDMMKAGSGIRLDLIRMLGDMIGTVDLAALCGVNRKTIARDKAALDQLDAALAGTNVPRRSTPYGDDDWYSPPEIIKAATAVMGGIDLDPASSPEANAKIGATRFYTADDDGLSKPWHAEALWLNPPYKRNLVDKFVTRLLRDIREGNIKQAVLLVSCMTETKWFQDAAGQASAIAFPSGRLDFWRADGKEHAGTTHGSAVLYFGRNVKGFRSEFTRFGFVVNTR